jgi:hypothetical protein
MWRLLAVLVAVLTLSCSRYETRSADGVTLRVDKVTGKTDKLVGSRWVPIGEPVAAGPPVALVEDRRGQPCKAPPNQASWANEIEEVVKTGCTPRR